jgi:tetratricopeptide (TPR) repeat protein
MSRPKESLWPPQASEAAVAELARRFDLDTATTQPATLEHLDWAIEHVGQAYLTTPPSELAEDAMRYERWVRELLAGDHTPSQVGELSVRLGYLRGILASLSFALGDHAAAQAYCATALAIAQELGHRRLKAWVLSTESQLATYHGDHHRVIELTQAGLAAAAGTPTFAAVKLASLQAKAHASLGDRGAAEAALANARRSLALVPPEEQVGGLFSFPEEKLASHEGDVYLRLGEPRRAQQALWRALGLLTPPPAHGAPRSTRRWSACTWRRHLCSWARSRRPAGSASRHWRSTRRARSIRPAGGRAGLGACCGHTRIGRRCVTSSSGWTLAELAYSTVMS